MVAWNEDVFSKNSWMGQFAADMKLKRRRISWEWVAISFYSLMNVGHSMGGAARGDVSIPGAPVAVWG